MMSDVLVEDHRCHFIHGNGTCQQSLLCNWNQDVVLNNRTVLHHIWLVCSTQTTNICRNQLLFLVLGWSGCLLMFLLQYLNQIRMWAGFAGSQGNWTWLGEVVTSSVWSVWRRTVWFEVMLMHQQSDRSTGGSLGINTDNRQKDTLPCHWNK